MHQIRILDAAARDLARLDLAVARRIMNRLRWLAENLTDIKPEALTGDLAGFNKLRIGDYRVVYEILPAEQTIVIHLIGHRRKIYRKP
ncbi:MAG: type II toxin-antitoxin system RelE/ParE family toxin [Anaerolineae bacterium]|nr:type II toxin-antitoxin system RelE/ParE family toxin [Anaerolineae bacterium]